MLNSKERLHKSPGQVFMQFLGLLMFAFYFILGLVIIFWSDFPLEFSRFYRILFGVALIVYSFFRFVRIMQVRNEER